MFLLVPGCCFGVPFGRWGRRKGLGVHGQRPARLQIRIAGCDHKGREQQASEVQIRTPASNPHSRLRSQGSPAVGFDANHQKGRGDVDHWLGGPSPRGGQVSINKSILATFVTAACYGDLSRGVRFRLFFLMLTSLAATVAGLKRLF